MNFDQLDKTKILSMFSDLHGLSGLTTCRPTLQSTILIKPMPNFGSVSQPSTNNRPEKEKNTRTVEIF